MKVSYINLCDIFIMKWNLNTTLISYLVCKSQKLHQKLSEAKVLVLILSIC